MPWLHCKNIAGLQYWATILAYKFSCYLTLRQ